MPNITLKFKDSVLSRHFIGRGQSLTIGRRKDNDIVIENLAVSGHHAKIDSVGEGFVLVDLQSKNGSFVNEQLVSSHWLKDGDLVSIGKHLLAFSTADGAPAAAPAEIDKTMVMDTSNYRSMVQKSAAVLPKPLLRQEDASDISPICPAVTASWSFKQARQDRKGSHLRDRGQGAFRRRNGGHHQPEAGRLLPEPRGGVFQASRQRSDGEKIRHAAGPRCDRHRIGQASVLYQGSLSRPRFLSFQRWRRLRTRLVPRPCFKRTGVPRGRSAGRSRPTLLRVRRRTRCACRF